MKTYRKILVSLTDEHKRILTELSRLEPDVPNRSEMLRRLIERAGETLTDGGSRTTSSRTHQSITAQPCTA